jgi:hypothetical protein
VALFEGSGTADDEPEPETMIGFVSLAAGCSLSCWRLSSRRTFAAECSTNSICSKSVSNPYSKHKKPYPYFSGSTPHLTVSREQRSKSVVNQGLFAASSTKTAICHGSQTIGVRTVSQDLGDC